MPSLRTDVLEVCVFRVREQEAEYLLLKRSPDDALYPGIWQVVTGTLEKNERAVDGAMREVREETGLAIERFWVVPHVNTFYTGQTDTVYLSSFFAAQVRVNQVPVLSREHDEFMWTTYEKAMTLIPWPGQRRGVQLTRDEILSGGECADLMNVHHTEPQGRSKE